MPKTSQSRTEEYEHTVGLRIVPGAETAGADRLLEDPAVLAEGIGQRRAGRLRRDEIVDLGAADDRLALDRDDLAMENGIVLWGPFEGADRGHDGVVHQEEAGERRAQPGGSSVLAPEPGAAGPEGAHRAASDTRRAAQEGVHLPVPFGGQEHPGLRRQARDRRPVHRWKPTFRVLQGGPSTTRASACKRPSERSFRVTGRRSRATCQAIVQTLHTFASNSAAASQQKVILSAWDCEPRSARAELESLCVELTRLQRRIA